VIIAHNRLKRPSGLNQYEKLDQDSKGCPFERGNEEFTPNEIYRINDSSGNWLCRVVPNLYKALSLEDAQGSFKEEFYEKKGGFGAHEVVIETPIHNLQMPNFSQEQFFIYLSVLRHRFKELQKDQRLQYISIFKNSGKNAGASIYHAHSQIIAMPTLPLEVQKQMNFQKDYFTQHSRTLLDDLVYEERYIQKRILFQNSSFIAYCPYASLFAFEVIVANTISADSIEGCSDDALKDLSQILQKVFTSYSNALGEFDFNMIFYNSAVNIDKELQKSNRFYLKIIPRLYNIAGFELSTSIMINPMPPEEAVKLLIKES